MFSKMMMASLLVLLGGIASAEDKILEPRSWSFPDVIESARKITPINVEGKKFDERGLVYSPAESSKMDVTVLDAKVLQNYADIVTHAYPDAVAKHIPRDCNEVDPSKTNETGIAGIAYVSLHAISTQTRIWAKECLGIIQRKIVASNDA